MYCRNCLTEFNADRDSFRTAEHFARVDDLLERATPNEFHPETDPPFDLLGAVNRNNVRMTHACEQPAFLDDGRGGPIAALIWGQQLQRHLSIEPTVPGSIDLTECADADPLQHTQVSPVFQVFDTILNAGERRSYQRRRETTVEVGESGEYSELGEHWSVGVIRI